MLTIKYISPYGVEKLFAVREIEFDNNSASVPCRKGHSPSQGHVRFIHAQPCPADILEHVYSGIVYAMNEAGKTVAKYDLGGLPNETCGDGPMSWTATTGTPVVGHVVTNC